MTALLIDVVLPLFSFLAIPFLLTVGAHLIARECYPKGWEGWGEDDYAVGFGRTPKRLTGRFRASARA